MFGWEVVGGADARVEVDEALLRAVEDEGREKQRYRFFSACGGRQIVRRGDARRTRRQRWARLLVRLSELKNLKNCPIAPLQKSAAPFAIYFS